MLHHPSRQYPGFVIRFCRIMFVIRSSLFTLQPRVRRAQNVLDVATSPLIRVLSAGGFNRAVTIDSRTRSIHIFETELWFRKTHRRVKFQEVEHVTYSYASAWTSWDLLGRVHDLVEAFSIGLKLKDSDEVVQLARYFGQGAAGDFSTWLMGDDLFDAAGTQEEDSRVFAKELCDVLEVSLGPAPTAPVADSSGRTWHCSACGRAVPPRPACLYCGGRAQPSTDYRPVENTVNRHRNSP